MAKTRTNPAGGSNLPDRMPPARPSPLTQEHLAALTQIIAACQETAAYCEQCSSCGIDVDRERRLNDEQLSVASRLKATFFPNAV